MIFVYSVSRTTDAQWGNRIHCMAENQLHFQIFRYGRSIFCLPHRPKISDFFDLCLRWVFVVRGFTQRFYTKKKLLTFLKVKSLKSNTMHCWRMKWQTRPRAKPRATKHLVSGGFGQNYLFFCFCLPSPKSPLLLPLLWHHLLVWPQLWSWRELKWYNVYFN